MNTPRQHHQGFTIVELLIVIVVIGILTAITIVAYNGVQNRANDTTVRSELANISKQIEIYRINSQDDSYPMDTTDLGLRNTLKTLNIKINKSAYSTADNANFVYIDNRNGQEFGLVAKSKSGKTFYYSSLTKNVNDYPGGSGRNFPNSGLTGIRPGVFETVVNPNANRGAWGWGADGWTPEWINQ